MFVKNTQMIITTKYLTWNIFIYCCLFLIITPIHAAVFSTSTVIDSCNPSSITCDIGFSYFTVSAAANNGTYSGNAIEHEYQGVQRSISVDFDPFAETLTYLDHSISMLSGGEVSFTTTVTTGFGQEVSFLNTITYDSVIADLDNQVGPLDLTLESTYGFSIDNPIALSTSALATGSYSIQGPTETVSGDFSVLMTGAGILYTDINASGYPNSIQITSDFTIGCAISGGLICLADYIGTNGSMYSGVIDGYNYTLTPSVEFSDTPVPNLQASVVPIPAALWLFGSGLLGLIGLARRRVVKLP